MLILFFLYFGMEQAESQRFFFDNYSVKEGLAHSTVYDIIQDSRGYVWLGSAVGVSCFDGIHFKNYTYENGLANDAVQRIVEDKWGNIWFGHKGGAISRFKNDSIQFFRPDTIPADITSMILDREGNIWAGSFGMGAIKIKNPNIEILANIDFIQYKGTDQLDEIVFAMRELQDGTIFFITPRSLKYMDVKDKKFRKFQSEELPQFYQFTCLFTDKKGNTWLGTDIGGLFRMEKDGSVQSYTTKDGLAGDFVSCISQDSEGTIWIGTWGNGISTFNNEIFFNYNISNGLPDQKIRCLKPDMEGNMLIGTNENGLCIFKSNRFINYSENDGIKGKQVNALLEDSKGRFWFGTDEGLSVMQKTGFGFGKTLFYNVENGKIPENRIKFIEEDKSGKIWVACEHSIVSFSGESGTSDYNFLVNGYINQNNSITALEADHMGNLWIGTLNGLIVYETINDKVSFLKVSDGLAGNDISALFVDSRGMVWIGSNQKGLSIFNEKDTSFTIIKAGLGYTPICITESTDQTVWIGTQAHGLLVFKGMNLLKQYRMKDGIFSDFISGITSGINGDIYIGTSRGLNIYKSKEKVFLKYSENAGFTGIEVKKNASIADRDGNIWFGTVKGATRIDISMEKENYKALPVLINGLKINNQDRRIKDNLVLKSNENSVVIDYIGICITDPQSVVYRIMLEGAEKEWQPETSWNSATFSNLAPGKYTFKVIAKNNSGIWTTEPTTLSFTIKPPFYRSTAFFLIVIFSALAFTFLFIKFRERSLINEKRILAEKVAERTIEISQKNKELEIKNKNITDSIKYAKRIQDAMLTDTEYLKDTLKNYFIFFKPRDIISGDYYWATTKGDFLIFAVVDCTGHGVPGAFMSMLGITLLDEIINKKNITNSGQILDALREGVIKSLKQKGVRGETQDGMDVALCSINTLTWEMQYSGAYNPIYIARNNEMHKFKADRMPIGIYFKRTDKFSVQKIQLLDNDVIYLFSDGFADQFGQKKGDKFMNKNFRELLLSIHQKPMDKQKKLLEETLAEWQGTLEQVDDVLVMGVRVNIS